MAVGDRIKRARNLRGMTQKELGIAIGFEEKSAETSASHNTKATPALLKKSCSARLRRCWT